ncbi:hypothetical protein EJ05DRAFT_278562 [Pseudovirgaria hyperparasitica]|uniref:Copper-fist domain-containing protein n=1 Tax=Pseudovirgaria hyperparasitica TaxID=470096 RepID=A0A6A6WCI6_9PEZI|nr:uncharacterized protein EJ05DRAFT_278562 [Pseudovirgaria hyperparasitica]KAF2760285.1 hypothetical protein EJ05DRAFT_278562 [Pseudovirgaria hyperparasitica]
MPVINGEKYACLSCIKGHRVSGCQHHDRELQHINPKGRPVKQCDHCRANRKTNSLHGRCDCKRDRKGDFKLGDVSGADCACHTGSKCLCGSKKNPGLRVETSMKAKPRLTSTQSESTLTVFANGHHKPVHHRNNAHHNTGMPYKVPHRHTVHGHGPSFGAQHSDSNDSVNNIYGMPAKRRSLDHLGITEREAESEASELYAKPLFAGIATTPTLISGPNSPIDSTLPLHNWPWTRNGLPSAYSTYGSFSTSPSGDYMSHDSDWAIPSAGLQPSWSATDLPLVPEKLVDAVPQPNSHSGDSNRASVPGLSTSSSQSEVGEPNFFGDLDLKSTQTAIADHAWEDAFHYHKSRAYRVLSNASTPPDLRQAPTSVPDTHSRNSLDLDYLRRTSPPVSTELESNYLAQQQQQQYGNPLMDMVPQEKAPATPTSTPFMNTEMESQPRSMPLGPVDEGSTAMNWLNYSDFPSSTFDNTEVPAYSFGDNFS